MVTFDEGVGTCLKCLFLEQLNKKKTNKNLHRLHDSTSLLEKQLDEFKKLNDKVIMAEVQCRSAV